jgi:hypothetical protein
MHALMDHVKYVVGAVVMAPLTLWWYYHDKGKKS